MHLEEVSEASDSLHTLTGNSKFHSICAKHHLQIQSHPSPTVSTFGDTLSTALDLLSAQCTGRLVLRQLSTTIHGFMGAESVYYDDIISWYSYH